MNKLKSIFIGFYPILAMGLGGYGIYENVVNGLSFIWLGAAMTTLPIMMFIGRVMMFRDMARTTAHFPTITILAVAGVCLAAYGYFVQASEIASMPPDFIPLSPEKYRLAGLLATVVGLFLYLQYNFWYSSLGRSENRVLRKGNKLPEFSLVEATGEEFHSSSLQGRPAIIIFFRGNWCPLCMAQIKELVAQYRELAATGARILLVSPQPEENTRSLARKFNVPFTFLTDRDNRVARILGIEMKDGLPMGMQMLGYENDTVYPTVIITDSEGKILYCDMTNNYRIRPEPEEFRRVLQMAY